MENIIERGIALATEDVIKPEHLPDDIRDFQIKTFRQDGKFPTLEEQEIEYIKQVLAQSGGNKTLAAETLGIDRVSLWRKSSGTDWNRRPGSCWSSAPWSGGCLQSGGFVPEDEHRAGSRTHKVQRLITYYLHILGFLVAVCAEHDQIIREALRFFQHFFHIFAVSRLYLRLVAQLSERLFFLYQARCAASGFAPLPFSWT